MNDDFVFLLARHLKRKTSEISRRRSPHFGMIVLECRNYEYAVGAPGFSENYYGPEIKLAPGISAYRLTPGGVNINTETPAMSGPHPSHETRISDASTFDEICTICGAHDTLGGWGRLADPCSGPPNIQKPPDRTVFVAKDVVVESDFKGVEIQVAMAYHGCGSGRMSCSEPNLANLPKKSMTPGTHEVANALHSLQAAVLQIESGESSGAINDVKKVMSNLAKFFDLELEVEVADPYAQWTTTCPKCGVKGNLEVKEVTLSETGKRHRPCTPLTAEGFDVNCSNDLENQSTEDEEIVCMSCGTCFDLGDLSLEKINS